MLYDIRKLINENKEKLIPFYILWSTDVVVSPPSVYLQYVRSKLPVNIAVAGQNCYKTEKGAYTGEIRYTMMHYKSLFSCNNGAAFHSEWGDTLEFPYNNSQNVILNISYYDSRNNK